ncbi:MAG: hypothetical protein HYS13_02455 [Planctomycetia bacterium]|nr:hypothetical protein [Planctomycetia bacterium]
MFRVFSACTPRLAVCGAVLALLASSAAAQAQIGWPEPKPSRNRSTYARPVRSADQPPPRNLRLTADPESRARIERALGERTKLRFDNDSLRAVGDEIEARHKIPVLFDEKALDDVRVSVHTPITKSLEGVTLRSALRLILEEHELAYVIDEGLLVVTSKTEAESMLHTVIYEVPDLLYEEGFDVADADSLVEVITSTVEPQSWEEAGGAGSLACLLETLVISSTDEVHDKTAAMLAALRTAHRQMATEKGDARFATIRPDGGSAEERIARRLEERVELDLPGAPLSALAATLASDLQIPVVFDFKALEDVAVTIDEPVTLRLPGVSARVALKYALAQHELAWAVENEALVITSQTVAECKLFARVYPVADLLGKDGDDYDSLIESVTSAIAPASWDEAGGPGAIREFEQARCLVVENTREVQAEVERLLTALRSTQPPGHEAPSDDGPQLRFYRLPLVVQGEERPTTSELRELLLTYVGPRNWMGQGGEGEIRTTGGGLLIRHTPSAHRAVAEFLQEFSVFEFAPPRVQFQGTGGFCNSVIPVVGENAVGQAVRRP